MGKALRLEEAVNRALSCSKEDNLEDPIIWVKEGDLTGLSVVKGLNAFFISQQDGNVRQIKGEGEGRDRVGLWWDYIRALRSLKIYVTLNGETVDVTKYTVKYVCGFGWKAHLYNINNDIKILRIDYVALKQPSLIMFFKILGKRKDNISLKIECEPGFRYMWPLGEIKVTSYAVKQVEKFKILIYETKECFLHVVTNADNYEFKLKEKVFQLEIHPVNMEAFIVTYHVDKIYNPIKALHICNEHEKYFEEITDYYEKLLFNTFNVKTPSKELNKVFITSKYVLIMLYSKTSMGCGWFAGMPRFTWFFTGDGCLLSRVANVIGLWDMSINHLETMASFSKANGQIPHEAVLIPDINSRKLYTGYMHVSATPLWIISLYNTYLWSCDLSLLKRNYERVLKALKFLESLDKDNDGFIEVFPEKLLIAWDEIAAERRKGACMEVNGLYILSLYAAYRIAEILSDKKHATVFLNKYRLLKDKFEKTFWCEDESFYYDRIHPEPIIVLSPYIALPLLYNLAPCERGRLVLDKIANSDLIADCGVRIYRFKGEIKSGYYEGSVWPLYNWIIGLSAYNYGKRMLGHKLMKALIKLALTSSDPGKINEFYEYDCSREKGQPIQGFSSAPVIDLLVEGILGIKVDESRTLTFEIQMPEEWNYLEFRNLRYNGFILSGRIAKRSNIIEIYLENRGKKSSRIILKYYDENLGSASGEDCKGKYLLRCVHINPGESIKIELKKNS